MNKSVSSAEVDRVYSRLAQYPVWVEENRAQGFVMLVTVRENGKPYHEALDETALNVLIAQGRVKCDASQRLEDGNPGRINPGLREVTNKYWSVVE